MRKNQEYSERHDRLERLDKLVPIVVLAYVAGRVAHDRLALNGNGHVPAALAPWPAPAAEPAPAPELVAVPVAQEKSRWDLTKKLLLLAMLAGIIAMVFGGGTFATFSAQTGNPNSSVAAGTLTMSDNVNATSQICYSNQAPSNDNYNGQGGSSPGCSAIVALTNQGPGNTDTTGSYIGGFDMVTIANTGSLNASLFSLFAPYVNGVLRTAVTNNASVGLSPATVNSFAVSSLEGPVAAGDKIVLNYGSSTQQFCAQQAASPSTGNTSVSIAGGYPANSTGGCSTTLSATITSGATTLTVPNADSVNFPATPFNILVDSEQMTVTNVAAGTPATWTVTRGVNGTSAAGHTGGATIIYASSVNAAALFAVGTRLNDTSTDTTPSNTDCYDAKTTTSPVSGAKVGTDLNFNSTTGNPFCSAALLWIQEQSTISGSKYNYCWFGRGSAASQEGGSTEDSAGQCRTPTQITLGSNVVLGSAPASTTLNGALAATNLVGSVNNSQNSITVSSAAGFPGTNGYTIQVDNEQMTVTAGAGTTSWTVTRGVNGTTAASHSTNATVVPTSITVNNGASFNNNDTVVIGSGATAEEVKIQSGGTTNTWTVTRAYNGTTPQAWANSSSVAGTTAQSLSTSGSYLEGNIKTNDQITLVENGNTLYCYATANSYISSSASVGVTGCYGAASTTFDSSAVVKDATSFTALNGTNTTSTISNFDTSHSSTGAIYMPPLNGPGAVSPVGVSNTGASVQLARHGDAAGQDSRVFYIGVYFPAPPGVNQNTLQGLQSIFGLDFHLDQ